MVKSKGGINFMLKLIGRLAIEIICGNLVSISRSNENLGNNRTLAHYDFSVKVKTPTFK